MSTLKKELDPYVPLLVVACVIWAINKLTRKEES